VLKLKFLKLNAIVVDSITSAGIIDFMFREKVLKQQDMTTLLQKNDPQQQCRALLKLLHRSKNPQTFVLLYRAIKNESHLQWLIKRIDECSDQSIIDLRAEQRYTSDPTGDSFSHI